MKHYFKPFIILKKLQKSVGFLFFFFYSHKSKLDALNPHYFIARVISRGFGCALACVALAYNGYGYIFRFATTIISTYTNLSAN